MEKTIRFYFAGIFVAFLTVFVLIPQAARGQGVHEGKFSSPATGRARIYSNAISTNQKVLVTVCVTTTGNQTADITVRDDVGTLVDLLSSVRFNQCRSVTAELALDQNISVGAPVAAAGTYSLSVLP